ncbi:MAG: J domain-containing protein [Chloroflexi bacterium]|nr:MAG: J domain-containing protein [Chloroflexota bacterium]
MKNYYDILGVAPDASDDEIQRMYRKLSRKYHPDANMDDPDLRRWAEERMKELNEAYATLKDPHKRARYDILQGYRSGDTAAKSVWTDSLAAWKQAYVLRTALVNAAIFGLFGLLRGGLPFALSGALIGLLIGSVIANIRISRLPREVSSGIITGMFIGALLLRLSPVGLLVGGLVGGLAGWYLRNKN